MPTTPTTPPAFRVRFEYDPEPLASLHDPAGDPLPGKPETYAENPIMELINPADDPVTGARRPLSWDEYCRTYGDPERHVVLCCLVEQQCACCGAWKVAESLCGIDVMRDSREADGFIDGEALTPAAALQLPGYLAEVAREMLTEAGWTDLPAAGETLKTTYRIEVRDETGRWVPAPGDAAGWSLGEAETILRAGVPTMSGEPAIFAVARIVNEQTGEVA